MSIQNLEPCPFCGGELFRCMDSIGNPAIKHKYMPGCTLSEIMWEDTPDVAAALNRRAQPQNHFMSMKKETEI